MAVYRSGLLTVVKLIFGNWTSGYSRPLYLGTGQVATTFITGYIIQVPLYSLKPEATYPNLHVKQGVPYAPHTRTHKRVD